MRMLRTFYVLCMVTLSAGLPMGTVIRYEYNSVFSEEVTFEERIFINGAPVTPNGKGDVLTGVIDVMPFNNGSSSLHDSLRVFAKSFNKTKKDHTYQRLRECSFNGHQVMHISDRIKSNGKDYLSLDQTTGTWVALDPQAVFLKKELDRDSERTVQEKVCFQEACTELMKDLNHSYSASKRVSASVLAPLLAALILFGLVILTVVSKHSVKGSASPAGILGSVVHYPAKTSDIVKEPAIQPSLSTKASLLSNMP